MNLIDAFLNFTTTAGATLGLLGVAVLVACAIVSFFADGRHPALQPAEIDADIIRLRGPVSNRHSDTLAVAA